VAPAIREAEALGFIKVTERGRGGNAEHRKANRFFLTFAHGRDSRAEPPTHEWRRFETIEEAESVARAARANKDADAVRFGQRRAKKNKNQSRNLGPKPVRETRTETNNSPVLESRTTGQSGNQDYLYISGRG
jgi:hypothetical protein